MVSKIASPELGGRVRHFHPVDLAGVVEPLDVLVEAKSRRAALRLVEAGALEHPGPVVKDVRERVNLRVCEVHEPAVHPDFLDVLVGHATLPFVEKK